MITQCSKCSAFYRVNDEYAGKSSLCKKCGSVFVLENIVDLTKSVTPQAFPAKEGQSRQQPVQSRHISPKAVQLQPASTAPIFIPAAPDQIAPQQQGSSQQAPSQAVQFPEVQTVPFHQISPQQVSPQIVAASPTEDGPRIHAGINFPQSVPALPQSNWITEQAIQPKQQLPPQQAFFNSTAVSPISQANIPTPQNAASSDRSKQAGGTGAIGGLNNIAMFQALSNNAFIKWFLAVNFAITITLGLIFQSQAAAITVVIIGFGGAFISLFASKHLAIKAHNISLIDPDSFQSEEEKTAYTLVEELSQQADLQIVPAVGLYESPDMNAFATGPNQNDSLVAFSSALMSKMSYSQIQAVAAHEIAHIANKDMLGTILIQGAVNSLIILATVPFTIARFVTAATEENETVAETLDFIYTVVGFILRVALTAIGNLFSLAYSRKREFKADRMASILVGPSNMIDALEFLGGDEEEIPRTQAEFSAFKVSGRIKFAEFFSTHPSMDRRIAALKNL